MTDTQKAAMRQALDALDDCRHGCEEPHKTVSAVTRLRAALAEPAVEPVAEVKVKMTGGNAGIATVINEVYSPLREPLKPGDKLYASPPDEVPLLTDGNISWLWSEAHNDTTDRMPFQVFARAIEQLVRQKAGIK